MAKELRSEQSSCEHTDTDLLRSAQLDDDEIAVTAYMAAEGRCPVCHSECEDDYREAVRWRRKGNSS